jgi:hypothetical protein
MDIAVLNYKKLLTLLTFFLFTSNSHATVITFDQLIGPGQVGPSSGNGFTDSGFIFSRNMNALDLSQTGYWCYVQCTAVSDKFGALNDYGGNMIMTMQGGGVFSVQDLWLRDWFSNGGSATIVGLLNGSVVSSVNVNLNTIWEIIVLNFATVDALEIRTDYIFTVDSIRVNGQVSQVSEPASMAMLLIGFGAFGFAARKRKNSTTQNA